MSSRDLQRESPKAINTMKADNNSISSLNAKAHHNSLMWYRAVIQYYIEEHGGLPSEIGPGKEVKLILDD